MDDSAYLLAIRYLSYRPRSIKEIRDYLKKKEVSDSASDSVITKLLEQKFLNDFDFAGSWVRTRVLLKPLSQRVLRLELQQKGIKKEIIDQVLSEQQEVSGSDFEMARLLIQKKKSKYVGLSRDEIYRKLGGFLGRRGFSYDVIKRSIDEVFEA
jgi:regulatory protein